MVGAGDCSPEYRILVGYLPASGVISARSATEVPAEGARTVPGPAGSDAHVGKIKRRAR